MTAITPALNLSFVKSSKPINSLIYYRSKSYQMKLEKNHPWLYIQGLLIALSIPLLPLSNWEHEFSGVGHLIGYEFIWWALVGLIIFQTVVLEKEKLSSIGFMPAGWREVFGGICIAIVTLIVIGFIYYWLLPRLHLSETSQVSQLTTTPLWWRVISVIRAAIGEEILFRGYAISRLNKLTNNTPLSAFISWAIFTIAHVGAWGWSHVIIAGFGGLMLTLAYLWKGNLWVSIIAHTIIDGVAVLT
jgi:uncharacterized protein